MRAAEIAFIINDCLEGVERSNVGGVFIKDADGKVTKDAYGSPIYSQAGFQVFMNVLSCYFPKNYVTEITDK